MWALDNQTPFAAERTFVRDRDGAEIWLVAVRATFDLFPDGSLEISKKQEPVALAPEYSGKPGHSSLRWDSDLQRTKLGTDVILNASAHVPPDQDDQQELTVGLQVDDLSKRLNVIGDRVWERTLGFLGASRPKPFRTMPITYERAFGAAPDEATVSKSDFIHTERNPVGIGLIATEGKPLPNIWNHRDSANRPNNALPVAGFGAVAGHWSPRRDLAGTYDEKWQQNKRPLLPDDFSDGWYQAAPRDQVTKNFLRGGERVELQNLTPTGTLAFNLPKYSFGFRTLIGGSVEHHRAVLHTVVIEPDANRLFMVWHTALPCHHTLYTLKRTTVFEKERREQRLGAA